MHSGGASRGVLRLKVQIGYGGVRISRKDQGSLLHYCGTPYTIISMLISSLKCAISP